MRSDWTWPAVVVSGLLVASATLLMIKGIITPRELSGLLGAFGLGSLFPQAARLKGAP